MAAAKETNVDAGHRDGVFTVKEGVSQWTTWFGLTPKWLQQEFLLHPAVHSSHRVMPAANVALIKLIGPCLNGMDFHFPNASYGLFTRWMDAFRRRLQAAGPKCCDNFFLPPQQRETNDTEADDNTRCVCVLTRGRQPSSN